jgi:hypothetical protein
MPTTVTSGNTISSITGFKVTSSVRIGDNSEEVGGDYEYMVTAPGTNVVSSRRTWQLNPTETIDSGLVPTKLEAQPGGGTNAAAWTVTGGVTVPLLVSTPTYGAITAVKVRAAVIFAECSMEWDDISAEFYKDGNLIETITYDAIGVDTTGMSDPVAREQILTITPNYNDHTKVIVNGNARLFLNGVEIPDPGAIFGQIYIFAA